MTTTRTAATPLRSCLGRPSALPDPSLAGLSDYLRLSVITLTIPLQLLDALEDRRAHRRYRCHAPRPLLELRHTLRHEHRRALGHGAARGLGLHQ